MKQQRKLSSDVPQLKSKGMKVPGGMAVGQPQSTQLGNGDVSDMSMGHDGSSASAASKPANDHKGPLS